MAQTGPSTECGFQLKRKSTGVCVCLCVRICVCLCLCLCLCLYLCMRVYVSVSVYVVCVYVCEFVCMSAYMCKYGSFHQFLRLGGNTGYEPRSHFSPAMFHPLPALSPSCVHRHKRLHVCAHRGALSCVKRWDELARERSHTI